MDARARSETLPEKWLAAAESGAGIAELRVAAAGCRACPLWKGATQTVFGEGAEQARLMLVGEQPGDREDREGHPFVGPAGRLLVGALEEAGLTRARIYTTNAVKHFKWTARGKRRIHERPNANEVRACRPWLLAEIAAIRPTVVLCLGATAAQSMLGSGVRVMRDRGRWLPSPLAPAVMATVHPSSLLRAPTPAARAEARERFVRDLRSVAKRLAAPARAPSRAPAARARRSRISARAD
jgi:DNA polymerase